MPDSGERHDQLWYMYNVMTLYMAVWHYMYRVVGLHVLRQRQLQVLLRAACMVVPVLNCVRACNLSPSSC